MNKIDMLNKLIDEVNELKVYNDLENKLFSSEMGLCNDKFEKHNMDVFKINIYILGKLFKNELNEFTKDKDKITLDDYYYFIESLELPLVLHELYMKMPCMLVNRKILSYVTDLPSFMGIKKD